MSGSEGVNAQSLDELFGCIPSNYTVLIEGEPGSSKTSLAIASAYSNAYSCLRKVLYITTNEGKAKLLDMAKKIGYPLEPLI